MITIKKYLNSILPKVRFTYSALQNIMDMDIYDKNNNRYQFKANVSRYWYGLHEYVQCNLYSTDTGQEVYITMLRNYGEQTQYTMLTPNTYLVIGNYSVFEKRYQDV